ncbi:MAG: hypothetical protein M0Z65_06435 [Firmicutes bacterium]|uniref:Sporulation related domain-containing protein n=1 Tax=Melghirimyces thermohalophilus TaxID=1236220 RepID=A0A1G6ICE2_9BACL|nr:hypothetical protein [Melghirimyces thermohalophilus]MDA8352819.1 hypothetical protein [Bacillota bacterium]SDC04128.1 hypothetical protein SAMN04488112_102166 [Melghirimyces thermohalophilus]
MLFRESMTVIHQSYGTPRVAYSLRNHLERNHISSQLKIRNKKGLTAYQLLVPRKKAEQAKRLLNQYKQRLEQA